jgi:hypothetical protein
LGLTFETFLFVASYDSHGHGGGVRAEQKLTADRQPVRSLLASGPAGTHGHIFFFSLDLCFFSLSSLVLLNDKRSGWSFLYRCSLATPYKYVIYTVTYLRYAGGHPYASGDVTGAAAATVTGKSTLHRGDVATLPTVT